MTFAYPHGASIFPPQTFAIAPGECVVLDGPAATGKSTLLDLLYALRSPASGSLQLDGIDLRDMSPLDVRTRCILLRDVEVVSGDIFHNILFGRDEIPPTEVYRVLRQLGVHESLSRLPAGLHTVLAPNGAPLSKTEAVLVVLARALVARPGLLLIDRILDGLDEESLSRVMETLQAIRGETTILLVSNREPLQDLADRRLTLPLGDPDAILTPQAAAVAH